MTIGHEVRDLQPGELRLHIYTIRCTCGHEWTHSETWGRRIASPSYFRHDPMERLDGEYTHIPPLSLTRRAAGCHRCIPVAIATEIPVKWGTPQPLPTPQPTLSPRRSGKRALTLEDF